MVPGEQSRVSSLEGGSSGSGRPLWLDLHGLQMEGDSHSLCVIFLDLGYCKAPQSLADVAEEVLDIAKRLNVAFNIIKQSENEVAEGLLRRASCTRVFFFQWMASPLLDLLIILSRFIC